MFYEVFTEINHDCVDNQLQLEFNNLHFFYIHLTNIAPLFSYFIVYVELSELALSISVLFFNYSVDWIVIRNNRQSSIKYSMVIALMWQQFLKNPNLLDIDGNRLFFQMNESVLQAWLGLGQ